MHETCGWKNNHLSHNRCTQVNNGEVEPKFHKNIYIYMKRWRCEGLACVGHNKKT
jgi:hypothetical protein